MENQKQGIIEIYTEYTPNPESLKFVVNRFILEGKSFDARSIKDAENSPLAMELFQQPFVQGVFIANNFVTVTKDAGYQWHAIIPDVKKLLKEFIVSGKIAVTAKTEQPKTQPEAVGGNGVESRIIELLETYVKPAVEQDGGAIQFKSFNEGIVTLEMQGSCSGCPSSTLTLKAGIEGMLKRMIPEVKEVVAEAV